MADALSRSESIPLDVESNGLHAFRPILCTMQVAVVDRGEVTTVFVLDTIALGDAALRAFDVVLARGPTKLIHDLAFDARMLVQHGASLANVEDTSVAARYLGIAATGLGSLLESRLGVRVDKSLQHHDWGVRPLRGDVLGYLAADVAHLPALAKSLREEAQAKDIFVEIQEETAYRLSSALAVETDVRPAWARIKGAHELDGPALGALSLVAALREREAEALNVPAHTVLGNDALLQIATTRTPELVRRLAKGRGARIADDLVAALVDAPDDVSAEARARFLAAPARLSREDRERRKRCEGRLRGVRRALAKERGVDEQVVLPGHCLTALVASPPATFEDLALIPGLGARRIERDGLAILAACGDPPAASAP